jgi:hypothetical protein
VSSSSCTDLPILEHLGIVDLLDRDRRLFPERPDLGWPSLQADLFLVFGEEGEELVQGGGRCVAEERELEDVAVVEPGGRLDGRSFAGRNRNVFDEEHVRSDAEGECLAPAGLTHGGHQPIERRADRRMSGG